MKKRKVTRIFGCAWTVEQLNADEEKRALLEKWDPPLYRLYLKHKMS